MTDTSFATTTTTLAREVSETNSLASPTPGPDADTDNTSDNTSSAATAAKSTADSAAAIPAQASLEALMQGFHATADAIIAAANANVGRPAPQHETVSVPVAAHKFSFATAGNEPASTMAAPADSLAPHLTAPASAQPAAQPQGKQPAKSRTRRINVRDPSTRDSKRQLFHNLNIGLQVGVCCILLSTFCVGPSQSAFPCKLSPRRCICSLFFPPCSNSLPCSACSARLSFANHPSLVRPTSPKSTRSWRANKAPS